MRTSALLLLLLSATARGDDLTQRAEVIANRAQKSGQSFSAEVLTEIESFNKPNKHADHSILELASLLLDCPAVEQAAIKPRLEAIALKGHHAFLRSVAFATLMELERDVGRCYGLAEKSIVGHVDWLNALRLLHSSELRRQANVKVVEFLESGSATSALANKPTAIGRFVRIEVTGVRRRLSLALVSVFAGGRNIAPRGDARQCATAPGGDANIAVEDHEAEKRATDTGNCYGAAWWELDLKVERPIQDIYIWVNSGEQLRWLTHFRVTVRDNHGMTTFDSAVAPRAIENLHSQGQRGFRVNIDSVLLAMSFDTAYRTLPLLPDRESYAFGKLSKQIRRHQEQNEPAMALRRLPRSFWRLDRIRGLLFEAIQDANKPDLIELTRELASLLPASERAKHLQKVANFPTLLRVLPHGAGVDRPIALTEIGKPLKLVVANDGEFACRVVVLEDAGLPHRVAFESMLIQPGRSEKIELPASKTVGYVPLLIVPIDGRTIPAAIRTVPKLEDLPPELRYPPPSDAAPEVRSFVKQYTAADFKDVKLANRSYERGRMMFLSAGCVKCHQLDRGGDDRFGPNVATMADNFAKRKMDANAVLNRILEPGRADDLRYRLWNIETKKGEQLSGLIVANRDGAITLLPGPGQPERVLRDNDIEEKSESRGSLMPRDLLNTLERDDVLDLLAFVIAGGDAKNAMFMQ